ncbi:hypothetical protein P4S70_10605 [Enterovibrio sp. Hal110]
MAGYEEKDILGCINYKSLQINITADENLGKTHPAPAPAPLVKLEAKNSTGNSTVTIKPSSVELVATTTPANFESKITLEAQAIKLHPTGNSVLTLKKEGAVATGKRWIFA